MFFEKTTKIYCGKEVTNFSGKGYKYNNFYPFKTFRKKIMKLKRVGRNLDQDEKISQKYIKIMLKSVFML